MPNFAAIALARMQAIVDRLPDVERTDNPPGCYFLVRRKIFAQVATVVDPRGEPVTMVVMRPDPDEREALLAEQLLPGEIGGHREHLLDRNAHRQLLAGASTAAATKRPSAISGKLSR